MVARPDPTIGAINRQLGPFAYEISSRLTENSLIVAASPPTEQLAYLESLWSTFSRTLTEWDQRLVKNAAGLEGDLQELETLEKVWTDTYKSGQDAHAPDEVLRRIDSVLAAIRGTRGQVTVRLKQILTTQDRVAEQNGKVRTALLALGRAREQALARVFIRDGEPIWSGEVSSGVGSDLMLKSYDSFQNQFATLASYVSRERGRFFFHAGLVVVLALAFSWARQRTRAWAKDDPSLENEALVFAIPIATAIVVSILFGSFIYPEAPRLLRAILGATALIPALLILRRLIRPTYIPILNVLVVFYFLDQFRFVAAPLSQLPRWIFLTELIGSIGFLVWLTRLYRSRSDKGWIHGLKRTAADLALLLFVVALGANIIGYVSLSYLIGNAIFRSGYVAMFLAATGKIWMDW